MNIGANWENILVLLGEDCKT